MYVPNVCVVVSAHLWFVVCKVGGYEYVCVSLCACVHTPKGFQRCLGRFNFLGVVIFY